MDLSPSTTFDNISLGSQNGALRPKSVNESGSEGLMDRYKPWVSVCLR